MILSQSITEKNFFNLLSRIHTGTLTLTTPDRITRNFGQGAPVVYWEIYDWSVLSALALRGDVGLGETYSQGMWDTPDLEALSTLALLNHDVIKKPFGGATFQRLLFMATDKWMRANSKSGSRKNISAHYDISNDFYARWLDPSMTYSAAVYQSEDQSLESAQHTKYDRLINAAAGGETTLEIGCGWGGFAERALQTTDTKLTAVTISKAQHKFAQDRVANHGYDQRADIRLEDYRDIKGKFDSIVSIEMVEAVGQRYWPTYFKTIKDKLSNEGRAALQAIIVEDDTFETYRSRTDFIRQYTFPGGMLISPGEISRQAERVGLKAENFFRFGKDYARTLREWRSKFEACVPTLKEEGYKPEFLRGWKYYLDTCAAAFEHGGRTNVVHVELSHV
ncbi:SAM-dependent methyltransferase [Hirschia maritima]|uniref:SAM-dependent methyltransferase n=1 Tax=Hirschia maritima TaxID=1121961 RepID=UPI0003796FBF|nr:cyclopropane-fatty-acyl-phospholipid synthase family protein [Hirschia maritima]